MTIFTVFSRVVLTERLGDVEAENEDAAAEKVLAEGRVLKVEGYTYQRDDIIPVPKSERCGVEIISISPGLKISFTSSGTGGGGTIS